MSATASRAIRNMPLRPLRFVPVEFGSGCGGWILPWSTILSSCRGRRRIACVRQVRGWHFLAGVGQVKFCEVAGPAFPFN
jgi:hypothetical protein